MASKKTHKQILITQNRNNMAQLEGWKQRLIFEKSKGDQANIKTLTKIIFEIKTLNSKIESTKNRIIQKTHKNISLIKQEYSESFSKLKYAEKMLKQAQRKSTALKRYSSINYWNNQVKILSLSSN